MLYKRWVIIFLVATSCLATKAQDVDSLLLKDEFTYEDSLSIFRLIDSLMTMDPVEEGSQIVARLSYNSNVLSAGRTLGIEQFGLAPGISYYHKTGLFADITSYWSKDFDPNLYLTTASVGYMHIFSKKFSAIANYDRYFYHQQDDDFTPYTNAVTVSPYLDLNRVSFRIDYSFYFGDAYANRLMPGFSLNLKKKNFLGLDRVSIYPSFYVLLGDETITELEFVEPANLLEAQENRLKYGMRYRPVLTERNVFGIMNYAFSLPLNVSVKNWMFNLSYTYSIPKALEDEPLILEESSFISASVNYFINLRSNKP